MKKDIVFKIDRSQHNEDALKKILSNHPEIKFVSFMSVDLNGNVTDERVPIKIFLEDLDEYLGGRPIQTDGSSVNLPIISELNDARVDLIVDLDCNWYVDYNDELIDIETDKNIGTIIIPAFIKHNDDFVDSRSILKKTVEYMEFEVNNIIKSGAGKDFSINSKDIQKINFTTATELEFWVKTPNSIPQIEDLSASEIMHEQYWNKIEGTVRTALEHVLLALDQYGLEPEMGHKEVGGVRPSLDKHGKYSGVMEQIEVDWKYTNPIDTADNQVLVKNIIKKIFNSYGLDVSFNAKPIENVAGSGMHLHLGINIGTNTGKNINIFNSIQNTFLSKIGYGALMGLLKNYEIVNPFISATEDAFKRLQPGYEAPVAVVTSLGKSIQNPTRNRTVLIGVINEKDEPLATRFELRSPNPNSNLYLTIAASYLAMLDGMKYAASGNFTEKQLLDEVSKEYGEDAMYLEKNRMYRSEEDIFDFYTSEERDLYFGKAPRNVYENLKNIAEENEKVNILKQNNIFTNEIIESYISSAINTWKTVIKHRAIKEYIKSLKGIQQLESNSEYDMAVWQEILNLKEELYKNDSYKKSIISMLEEALEQGEYENASNILIELNSKMKELQSKYKKYVKNIL